MTGGGDHCPQLPGGLPSKESLSPKVPGWESTEGAGTGPDRGGGAGARTGRAAQAPGRGWGQKSSVSDPLPAFPAVQCV